MRKTFTLTPQQYQNLLDQMQPQPYLVIGGHAPLSQQERANDAWAALGKELGFDGMTVQPGVTKYEFTAKVTESQDAAPTKD